MPRRIVYLLPLLSAACASLPPSVETAAPTTVQLAVKREPHAEEQRGAALYYVMLAEMAGRRGQFADTSRLYLEAAKLSRDPRVAERSARIALFAREGGVADQAIELWKQLEPEHPERWQAEVLTHHRAGRELAALDMIDRQLMRADTRRETYRQVVALLTLEGPSALEVVHGVAQRHAEDGEAWFALAQFALHFKQFDAAEAALRKLIRLQPERKDAHTLLAGVYFSHGDIEGGLRQVKETLERFPDDQGLKLNYARALIEARRQDEARPLFAELLRKNPKDDELRHAVALLALDARDYPTAERELRRLLKSASKADSAAYYLGRMEEQRGHEAEARAWYARVSNGEMRMDGVIRSAVLDARRGHLDSARTSLVKARKEQTGPEERVRLFLAEADLLKRAGQAELAHGLLTQALHAHPGEPDLLYTRALLADQLDRFPEAETDLRAILAQDPDHAEALNALGFTLAERNTRLDEARELIEKALKLDPDSPAILDSMGWVLYRLGKPAEAEPPLRKAYGLDQDGEIAAHLAEVLFALGRRDEARGLLDEAIKREPERHLLLNLRQRIDAKPADVQP
ncbi:MAG: tetratricopeptide repeat protein [Pseudomonadota bacterium]